MSSAAVRPNLVYDYHTENFHFIPHTTLEAATKNEEKTTHWSSLIVDADIAYIAYPDGGKTFKNIRELQGKIFSERIELDHTVFGSDVIGLQKVSEDISDFLCEDYKFLQNALGMENWNSETLAKMKALSFGCSVFPIEMIGQTLLSWVEKKSRMEKLYISRRTKQGTTEQIIKEIQNYLAMPLILIWNAETHKNSLFQNKILKQDSKNTSVVNMYTIFSEDKKHLAVLSISDYVISIHFGSFHKAFSAESLLKTAFSEVTDADFFYEIDSKKIETLRNAHL